MTKVNQTGKKAGRKMKKFAKTLVIMTAFAFTLLFAAKDVHAEGLSASADKDTYEVGDKAVITVNADKVGDGTIPPDIQVEFDERRLNFENCSVEYGGGGGGLVTFKDKSATIDFSVLSGGTAEVKVTALADDAAEPETATVTLSVNGEDTAAAGMESEPSSTGVAAGTLDIGEGRVVQTVYADEFNPKLFHKETIEYKGQTVECAKFDMGDMTLLYTSDASGSDGRFMILDPASQELTDFRMIEGIENHFIIVLSDCEGAIPAGYTKAVLEWNGQTLTAFMEESVAAGTAASADGINPADFFLVYAMSSEGNKGWYRYDKTEGTYQRFITGGDSQLAGTDGAEAEDETSTAGILDDYIPGNIQSILVIALVPFALILIIVMIVLIVKVRDLTDELDSIYEGGYYEDEEEDDEEKEEVPVKRGQVTAASLVGRSMAEEDDDEEEDEEDEEEEEDDEEEDEEAEEEEEDDEEEDEEDDEEDEEDEEEDEEEDDEEDDRYSRPLTRREQRELAREEKWRLKEEKKAAKRRARGYEEATPMDWSSFEKERDEDVKIAPMRKSKPPKYMTESLNVENDDESDMMEEKPKKAPLPPRKKVVTEEEIEKPRALHDEDARERQRRLFEQQQRIEEQRRIEKEAQEKERLKEQQQFIASRTEDMDLDEDFQFEFLDLK